MARRARLKSKLDNQAYHVMTRTCRRAFFFHDEVDKEWVYREILRLAEVFSIDLHAVTVMSNHYHIVLSVRKPVLSDVLSDGLSPKFQILGRSSQQPQNVLTELRLVAEQGNAQQGAPADANKPRL